LSILVVKTSPSYGSPLILGRYSDRSVNELQILWCRDLRAGERRCGVLLAGVPLEGPGWVASAVPIVRAPRDARAVHLTGDWRTGPRPLLRCRPAAQARLVVSCSSMTCSVRQLRSACVFAASGQMSSVAAISLIIGRRT
jgi:hypothetical protein